MPVTDVVNKTVHVAVGIIVNAQQQILLAYRHPEQHQGGLWEFPGGKVDRGESVEQALVRELQEELGITAVNPEPFFKIHHNYSDKSVLLDIFWVKQFSGEAQGLEGQKISWVQAEALRDYQFPEANIAIVEALQNAL